MKAKGVANPRTGRAYFQNAKIIQGDIRDMSAGDLLGRGFKYLGPVTVYSHLQACGIVNDHLETCPRYAVVNAATEVVRKRRFRESGIVDFARRAGKDART